MSARPRAPVWIDTRVARVFHSEQLAEHGGAIGVRDAGLLESALARTRHLLEYAESPPSHCRLAAAYAVGILRNRPFVDGNKRTALVVALAFLDLNGIEFDAPQEEVFLTVLDLAAGRLTEAAFAAWLERHTASAK